MSWDDGKHTKVKGVKLTFDDVIRSIQVEYDGTNLQSQRRGTAGTKSDGFTLSPDEYITGLYGYTKTTFSGDIITALTFTTNKTTYGPYGNETQHYFSAEAPKDNQIAGFQGTSGNALNSIDVHFAPIPPAGSIRPKPIDPETRPGDGESKTDGSGERPGDGDSKADGPGKTELVGGKSGNTFDDGRFDGVKKITVGADEHSVTYIKIEYVKDGKVQTREHGTIRGILQEFSVDYPKDNITAVGGSYDHIYTYDTKLITSLYFTTSSRSTSPLFGKMSADSEKFNLEGENGGKLVGFHGRGGIAIDAIGAYFDTGSKHVVPIEDSDSGRGPNSGSKPVDPETQPDDGRSKPVGPGPNSGEGSNSGKGPNSDSSTQKLDAQGSKGGNQWDDGGDHEGVTKIHVVASYRGVEQIRFGYLKNGQPKEGPAHGEIGGSRSSDKTIDIRHPEEYLVSVKGWYDDSSNVIQGLQFQTSTKTYDYFMSPFYEDGDGTEFTLEVKDRKIVGFHGFSDSRLNSLGAYFAPIITPTPSKPGKKLKAVGGDEGDLWDDGVFDGVRKIHVGQNNDGVSFVEIEYKKGSQIVPGDGHGKKSALGVETFELTYPGEYIEAVGVYYDKVYVGNRGVILVTSLVFMTNEQKSPPFGMTSENYFELKEEGQKIVGFHGKAGDWVHQIGVYVAPITN